MVAVLAWIVAVLQGIAATTAIVLWHAVDGPRRHGARRLAPLPSLVVVRPIRGLDPGLAANVRAALAQRYPGALDTIFVLDETGDPAYPVVRRLVETLVGTSSSSCGVEVEVFVVATAMGGGGASVEEGIDT